MLSFKSKSANTQTLYNILSTVARAGVIFFTMPIFTRIMGAEQFGQYALYQSWFSVLACFIALGGGQGLATGMYTFRADYPRFRSSILLCGTVMCGIVTIFGILLFIPFSEVIYYSIGIYIVLFLESAASYVTGFVSNDWIYEKKAYNNMVLAFATLFFTTALSLILIIYWPGAHDELYVGRVIGVALPNIIIAVIVWIKIFSKYPTGYNRKYWLYSFSFGVPLVFHTLSQQVLISSDRIMMQYFSINSVEIGIYSFFYSFVNILSAVLGALNNSWVPFLYDDLDEKNYQKLNYRIWNYVQVYTVICCIFLLLSREVSKIFASDEYWSGMSLVPILSLVIYCTFMYQFPVNYEFFLAKPRIVAYGTSLSAIENLLLNVILIPKYGMYGAAIATFISYATLAAVHTYVVMHWKLETYPLIWKPLFVGLFIVIATCALFYVLADWLFLRWIIALVLGIYLIKSVIRRKTIF